MANSGCATVIYPFIDLEFLYLPHRRPSMQLRKAEKVEIFVMKLENDDLYHRLHLPEHRNPFFRIRADLYRRRQRKVVAVPNYHFHVVESLIEYLTHHRRRALILRSITGDESRADRRELSDRPKVPFCPGI